MSSPAVIRANHCAQEVMSEVKGNLTSKTKEYAFFAARRACKATAGDLYLFSADGLDGFAWNVELAIPQFWKELPIYKDQLQAEQEKLVAAGEAVKDVFSWLAVGPFFAGAFILSKCKIPS